MLKNIFKSPASNFDVVLAVVFYAKIISIFLPLEFNNQELRENFKIVHNPILVIVIFVWIVLELNKPSSGIKLGGFLALLIPLLFVFCVVLFFVVLTPCITEERREIYKEKSGDGLIVERLSNCGATTDYGHKVYYVKPVTPLFNFIWKTDTTDINKNDYLIVKPH